MGTNPNKTNAYKNKAVGNIQETTGKIFKNDSQKVEGQTRKNIGESELNAANVQNRTSASTDNVKGNLKEAAGKVTGNDTKKISGQNDKAGAKKFPL